MKRALGKKASLIPTKALSSTESIRRLLGDVRSMIETARQQVAQAVNAGLVMLYWSIGTRIHREVLGEKRAKYGEEIVSTVSRQLTHDYGRGYSRQSLFHMLRFAEAFPDVGAAS